MTVYLHVPVTVDSSMERKDSSRSSGAAAVLCPALLKVCQHITRSSTGDASMGIVPWLPWPTMTNRSSLYARLVEIVGVEPAEEGVLLIVVAAITEVETAEEAEELAVRRSCVDGREAERAEEERGAVGRDGFLVVSEEGGEVAVC